MSHCGNMRLRTDDQHRALQLSTFDLLECVVNEVLGIDEAPVNRAEQH